MAGRPLCPGPCTNLRGRGKLLCSACWRTVPVDIRRELDKTFKPNAGVNQNAEWLAAAARAINSLRAA